MNGEFALCLADPETADVTMWRGWLKSRWWNGPLLFWDDFSDDGKLGADRDAGTLSRLSEIKGEMLVVFGEVDPHVSPAGRKILIDALAATKVNHTVKTYAAEHAFMRDEGPRYDSQAADAVWAHAVALFTRTLGS